MILDSVESFEKYCDIEDGFQKVYSFIRSHKLEELEEGRHEIDGNRVYCTVWSGELKSPEEAKLEVHDSYIDVQLLLEGAETIGHKDRRKCNAVDVEYDEVKDVAFFADEPDNYIVLGPGNLAILFPADAHAPLLGSGSCRKIVFKIKIIRQVRR